MRCLICEEYAAWDYECRMWVHISGGNDPLPDHAAVVDWEPPDLGVPRMQQLHER